MQPGNWIAFAGLLLVVMGNGVAIAWAALKLSFCLGEISKTIKTHSTLFRMIPCLKPHLCALSCEEEQK